PYSIVWNTTTAANGAHTLKAIARDGAGNLTTSTAVNVTVSNTAPTGLSIDATAFGDQPTAKSTVATAAFSTTTINDLLLAFVSADDVVAGNTVTGVSRGGLTWALVQRTNTRRGTAEIWRAFATAPLTGATVTATLAQSVASSITVVSIIGADTTGISG